LKNIAPVILAAGDSTRMGYPKALLPFGKGTFLRKILETLAWLELAEPFVVVGKDADRIAPTVVPFRASILVNPEPGRGQLSSMQLALAALDAEHEGCLFWPVDQPSVAETVVRGLVRLFEDSGALLTLPVCNGRRGHPAIFRRELFNELLTAPIGEGPKRIVTGYEHKTALFPCLDLATIHDVDTPEDYLALTGVELETSLRGLGVARYNS
jgi:molybdenum cofactor cytidylyltransferase